MKREHQKPKQRLGRRPKSEDAWWRSALDIVCRMVRRARHVRCKCRPSKERDPVRAVPILPSLARTPPLAVAKRCLSLWQRPKSLPGPRPWRQCSFSSFSSERSSSSVRVSAPPLRSGTCWPHSPRRPWLGRQTARAASRRLRWIVATRGARVVVAAEAAAWTVRQRFVAILALEFSAACSCAHVGAGCWPGCCPPRLMPSRPAPPPPAERRCWRTGRWRSTQRLSRALIAEGILISHKPQASGRRRWLVLSLLILPLGLLNSGDGPKTTT